MRNSFQLHQQEVLSNQEHMNKATDQPQKRCLSIPNLGNKSAESFLMSHLCCQHHTALKVTTQATVILSTRLHKKFNKGVGASATPVLTSALIFLLTSWRSKSLPGFNMECLPQVLIMNIQTRGEKISPSFSQRSFSVQTSGQRRRAQDREHPHPRTLDFRSLLPPDIL